MVRKITNQTLLSLPAGLIVDELIQVPAQQGYSRTPRRRVARTAEKSSLYRHQLLVVNLHAHTTRCVLLRHVPACPLQCSSHL